MIDEHIIKFIKKHHVLTLATCNNNKPWCCNCFYSYNTYSDYFIFTSDDETRHGQEALANENSAASIVLETSVVGNIQGLQIEGRIYKPTGDLLKTMKTTYLKQFPFAVALKTNIWVLEPTMMKYTDNRLGFGKKLIWSKNPA